MLRRCDEYIMNKSIQHRIAYVEVSRKFYYENMCARMKRRNPWRKNAESLLNDIEHAICNFLVSRQSSFTAMML